MKNKKNKFFSKAIIYLVGLVIIFLVTVFATKYYFYDSDYSVKKTDLRNISIDGIKIGMNINDIDVSKYTSTDEVVDKCNYNFEEISFKTDSKGVITYIVASFKKIDFKVSEDNTVKVNKVNDIWKELGENYKTEMYKPEENNMFFSTTKGKHCYSDVNYSKFKDEEIFVLFGKETKGLPEPLLQKYIDKTIRIPMRPVLRSLNLSNSVCVIAYEILRQNNFGGLQGESEYFDI